MNTPAAPSLRMADAILAHVETFFAESGCPLTEAQSAAMADAHRTLAAQIVEVAA